MWLLIAVGVVILIWGASKGYPTSPAQDDGGTVDALLYWAYALCGLAVAAIVVFGIAIAAVNNPKSLIKLLIEVVAICVIVAVVYAVSAGNPALGLQEQPTPATLKLTDTILNLTYAVGACAILSIIFGEVFSAIRNK